MQLSKLLTDNAPLEQEEPQTASLANSMRSMEIDIKYENPQPNMPSIEAFYDHLFRRTDDVARRGSCASVSSTSSSASTTPQSTTPQFQPSGSVSSSVASSPRLLATDRDGVACTHGAVRRLNQIRRHVHRHPYPTPHGSPIQRPEQARGAIRRAYTPRQAARGINVPQNERETRKQEKAIREKHSRGTLCRWLSHLQNVMIEANPMIAQVADWKPLKSNNINNNIENPLAFNKANVIDTSIKFIYQYGLLLQFTIQFIQDLGHNDLALDLRRRMSQVATGLFEDPIVPLCLTRASL